MQRLFKRFLYSPQTFEVLKTLEVFLLMFPPPFIRANPVPYSLFLRSGFAQERTCTREEARQ